MALVAKLAPIICFDVDSTLITSEAIDELAAFVGKKEAVAALTMNAMAGSLSFRESLVASLEIVNPTSLQLEEFLAKHPPEFTAGVESLIDAFQRQGALIFLVSGGFTQCIFPLADKLGIPRARVFANTIVFDSTWRYAGFDTSAPTSEDGGKARVVSLLRATYPRLSPVLMLGDGVTDMQARPPADAFIGYGGVVVRPAVEQGADWFVRDWEEVLAVVEGAADIDRCAAATREASHSTSLSQRL